MLCTAGRKSLRGSGVTLQNTTTLTSTFVSCFSFSQGTNPDHRVFFLYPNPVQWLKVRRPAFVVPFIYLPWQWIHQHCYVWPDRSCRWPWAGPAAIKTDEHGVSSRTDRLYNWKRCSLTTLKPTEKENECYCSNTGMNSINEYSIR